MARFDRSKPRRDSKRSSPRRDSGRNFDDSPREREYNMDSPRRDSGRRFEGNPRRDSGRGFNRNKPDFQKTKVICSSCGEECEVPFRPSSNKPVYCDACFSRKDKGGSGRNSGKDLDIINEKLDRIMKALKIE
jgi:CxxC-x17-CxxC domain-containing protein